MSFDYSIEQDPVDWPESVRGEAMADFLQNQEPRERIEWVSEILAEEFHDLEAADNLLAFLSGEQDGDVFRSILRERFWRVLRARIEDRWLESGADGEDEDRAYEEWRERQMLREAA